MSFPDPATQEAVSNGQIDGSKSLEQESHAVTESRRRFQTTISRFSFNGSGGKQFPSSSTSPRKRSRTQQERSITPEDGSSSKKAKRKKPARGYSSPEVYSHLNHLNDCISESLDIIFCGINPGQRSAEIGHHFGHPSNHFWKCLHLSGLTLERIPPTEDFTLPERFQLGLTNIVERPTAEATELRDSEFKKGIAPFLAKLARYRPRIACFIGLRTGRIVLGHVMRARPKSERPTFSPGLQPYKIIHSEPSGPSEEGVPETLFYSVPSTSGKTQGYQIPDKVKLFAQLKADLKELKDGNLSTEKFVEISS
ncbi:uracil-DNA glycosylase-like protein [Lentinula edodes]|uniref:uracil-DNA glycosylase-like protein n=1 Tax=Lentinula edodes TaxID=5353 RepID=UPI001E8D08C7|nr:uracil-DNA glycosylase-like protein [Lentinula edodes]KAH7871278.1 uracil-DNA glycosylase-like protein [Lentinula edodes]